MRTLQGVSITGTGSSYRIGDYRGYEDTERDRVSLDYEYDAPSTDGFIDAANLSLYWTRLSKESGAGDRLTNNSLYIREDSMRNSAFGIVGGLESGFELGGVQHTVRFGGNAMTTDFSQELYANTAGVTSSSQSDMPDVSGKSLGLYLDDEIAFGNGFRLTPACASIPTITIRMVRYQAIAATIPSACRAATAARASRRNCLPPMT